VKKSDQSDIPLKSMVEMKVNQLITNNAVQKLYIPKTHIVQ